MSLVGSTTVKVGVGAVENIDADLLVFGEVGIGNTTPAAAVTACSEGARRLGRPGTACRARRRQLACPRRRRCRRTSR